jgi:hypothetical protein
MVNSYTSKSRQIYPASTTEVCEAMEFEDISETKEFIEVKHLEVQKCYEFIEEEPEDNNFTVEVWYPELDEYRNINENNKYDAFKSVSGQAGMKKTDENESVDFESSGRPAGMKKTDDIENVETANSEFNEMNSAMTKSEHSEHSERTEMIEDSVEYMNKFEVSCAMVKSNVEVIELEEMNNPEVSCAMIMSNEGIMEVEEMEVVKEASDTKDRHEKKTQKRIEDCWGITLRKPVTSSLSIKKIKSIRTGKVTKPISKGKKTVANTQNIKSKISFFNNISGMGGQEVACKLIFDTGNKIKNLKTILKPKLSTYNATSNIKSESSHSNYYPGLVTHHSVHTPSGGEVGVGKKIS